MLSHAPFLLFFRCLQNLSQVQYYAVFDGHGGSEASNYACRQLHKTIVQDSSFPEDIPQAMKNGVLKVDEEFCAVANRDVSISYPLALIFRASEQEFNDII